MTRATERPRAPDRRKSRLRVTPMLGKDMKTLIVIVALILGFGPTAFGETANQPGGRLPDKPFSTKSIEAVQRLEQAIRPYVEKAKATYPDARRRFIAGLPPKQVLSVTTRLRDSNGSTEQVFVDVDGIEDGIIFGRIANNIRYVRGYRFGDKYSFPETELIDCCIVHPDGSEEGNLVGNFLDEYQKTMNSATQRGAAPDRQETAPASR